MNVRTICECGADVTPTNENGEGWIFHYLAGHKMKDICQNKLPIDLAPADTPNMNISLTPKANISPTAVSGAHVQNTNQFLYLPLYDTKIGGGARAFVCQHTIRKMVDKNRYGLCARVTRTERGMWMHLLLVHGIKRQGELWASEEK